MGDPGSLSVMARINLIDNTRFELYLLLGRRIAGADSSSQAVGIPPNTIRLIRYCDAALVSLWKQRRIERAGDAARIVEAWWGLHRWVAPVVR